MRQPATVLRGRVLNLISFLGVVLGSLSESPARADYVVRKDGKRLHGLIREETSHTLRFETTDRITLTFNRSEIERVERQESRENLLLSATILLRRPEFIEASELLRRALDTGQEADRIRKAVVEVSPHFLDRLNYMSGTERRQWLALCDDLSRRGPPDSDWAYFRGDMALAMGDPTAALGAWRSLDAKYFGAHRDKRERVIRWAQPRLSNAISEGRLEESVGMLELINALDPARGKSCRVVLAMERARGARKRGNVGEACRIYAGEVVPLSPEIGKVCLLTVLEPECDLLCERGHFSQAMAFVRECATPHTPELAARLTTKIYRQHIEQCLSDGKWEMARGLLAEGSEYFDAAELERLKQECHYGQQRALVPADDAARHFQLGLELQQKKMNGAAIEEFALASRSSQLKAMAEKQITLIREGEALILMEKLVGFYSEKRYVETLDAMDEFRRKYARSEMTGRVEAIGKLAHAKLADEAHTAEALALSRIEQARRLLYRGQTDQALDMVDNVLQEQFTTATVATEPLVRARALKQEILKTRIAEGMAAGAAPKVKPSASVAASSLLPELDPAVLDQLNEDAFKSEIQEILKQLEL